MSTKKHSIAQKHFVRTAKSFFITNYNDSSKEHSPCFPDLTRSPLGPGDDGPASSLEALRTGQGKLLAARAPQAAVHTPKLSSQGAPCPTGLFMLLTEGPRKPSCTSHSVDDGARDWSVGTVSATPQEGGLKKLKLPCLGGKGRSLGTITVRRIIKESCPENHLPNSLPLRIL